MSVCAPSVPRVRLLEMPSQVTEGTATWPPGSGEPFFDFQGMTRAFIPPLSLGACLSWRLRAGEAGKPSPQAGGSGCHWLGLGLALGHPFPLPHHPALEGVLLVCSRRH